MGRELLTHVTIDGKRRDGVRVHLDSRTLQIGGRPRVAVELSGVQALDVRGSELRLATPDGIFEIELGAQAAAWAAKIRSPPSRAQKLGLTTGLRVVIVGLEDAALNAEVSAAGARRVEPGSRVDLLFLGAETSRDLARLPRLVRQLAPAGAVWIVRRTGRGAEVAEGDVRAAGRAAGLVDVKAVAFSETHSADKFVFPVAARRTPAGAGAARTPERLAAPRPDADTTKRARATASEKRAATKPAAEKRAPTRPATKRATTKPAARKQTVTKRGATKRPPRKKQTATKRGATKR